jgi:hypothetical protein
VEQSAEEVAPPDLRRVKGRGGRRVGSAAAVRWSQAERSVWTLLVEVADVDAEDVLKLAAAEDQEPVEALPAHAADPAFGVGIRVRRLDRRSDDLDAWGALTRSSCKSTRIRYAAEFVHPTGPSLLFLIRRRKPPRALGRGSSEIER